ncbi:hypothetical protein FACS1894152_7460 [Bacilli bacterium]|nr:hypothetical protein FACS1894152_7460 [Bacilli bacterium]
MKKIFTVLLLVVAGVFAMCDFAGASSGGSGGFSIDPNDLNNPKCLEEMRRRAKEFGETLGKPFEMVSYSDEELKELVKESVKMKEDDLRAMGISDNMAKGFLTAALILDAMGRGEWFGE